MAYVFKKYDDSKKEKGAWVNIDGGRFKIAAISTSAVEQKNEEIRKRNEREYGKTRPPLDVQIADDAEAISETLLHDWDGIIAEDENGKEVPVPFTRENAYELLLNDDPLRKRILLESQNMANYQRERVAKQAKKRRTTSNS